MIENQRKFEDLCQKQINYVKTYYSLIMTPSQRKQLQKLQSISRQLIKFINQLPFQNNEVVNMFSSIHKQLKLFKRQVQNQWKYSKTDYDAFITKSIRTNSEMVDIMSIISITRFQKQPVTLKDLKDINFPVLGYQNRQLVQLAIMIIKDTEFYKTQDFPPNKIDNLITKISKQYNVVSYHNFSHGFSVFLMCYQLYIRSIELKTYISEFQLFCLLLGGISHDLNHKGINNMYQIKRQSSRAIDYSNQSILQNMHISTLFSILSDNEIDILSCIKDPLLRQRSKRLLTRCILATDMTKHFPSVDKFKEKREATDQFKKQPNALNEYLSFQPKRQQDRQLILQYIIHASDISNPCLSYQNYMNWAALLAQQFNQQYKKELKNDFEPTSFLKYTDQTAFYKGQIGFSKSIILPLWKQFILFSPCLTEIYHQLENNIKQMTKRIGQ